MRQKLEYDYIVTGGGCAGLSIILHALNEPALQSKRILLIEMEDKSKNDRTWCFWEKSVGLFESVVCKQWDAAWFHAPGYSSLKKLHPYSYKMIRGIDFYNHCHEIIRSSGRVTIRREQVMSIHNINEGVSVVTDKGMYTADFAFNSILFAPPLLQNNYYLLQHFKGWVIETEEPHFDIGKATLMDFRVSQQAGTTFVYVMPLTETKALIEFTLFTNEQLEDAAYDAGLKDYITTFLGIKTYRIIEEEFGIIPMTDFDFPRYDEQIINIGTAGGQTKPSSGYTFRFIQKHSADLVQKLKTTGKPYLKPGVFKRRFMWYDKVLLHMLHYNKMPGARIFSLMFKRNKIGRIFRFLDNETTILNELVLLNTLPQFPFMKAGFKELMK